MEVGGLERIVVDLVREGTGLNHQTTVLCVQRSGALAGEVGSVGGKVICVDKGPGIRLRVVRDVREVLQEIQPHVLHTHQVGALLYCGPAAERAKVPVVVHTEHGKHFAHSLKARLLGRFAGRYANRWFCVSQDVAKEVRANRIVPAAKIFVAYNGIRTDHFAPRASSNNLRAQCGIPKGALIMGTVGRLAEVKRQDILIRGLLQIRKYVSNVHLLLVGDGVMRAELTALAAELGLAPFIHFAGYQSDPADHLRIMDIFALTSRSEGMPLGILEAWAAGVPVVASKVGGVPELILDGQTGLLFESGSVEQFAAAVRRLISDPALKTCIGQRAQELVRKDYDVKAMAQRYDSYYRQLLATSTLC
jgi:glycosyltransferase involved in cell wall biosynthesis